jgi:hypothetical protein
MVLERITMGHWTQKKMLRAVCHCVPMLPIATRNTMSETTIHIRLRPELKRKIHEASTRCGMSQSNWLRMKMVEILGAKPEMAFAPKTRNKVR